tara:strand:- start:246 stop:1682 length:1437 start_codon:yes stop_codon:yes gene_type:complete
MNRFPFSLPFLTLLLATTPLSDLALDEANADDVDVKQINKEVDAVLIAWEKAFNAKDADRVISLYAERFDVIYEDDVRHRTRKSLKNHFEKRFKEEPNRKVAITDVERLIVSPTLVIESGVWANTGGTDSSRPTRGRYSCTLQKVNGTWLVIHDRSWGMPLAEGRSELRTRDPLSDRAHEFFQAFSKDDKKFLENIFTDDVEVWVNDLKVTGKKAYLKRAHHILNNLYKKVEFGRLHVHTNYFSPNARGFDGKTISEIHPGPVIWTNAWFDLDVVGRTTKRAKVMRSHVDLRWQDGKIAEMLVYGDSSFMAKEQSAFDDSQRATATLKDFERYCNANVGSWTGQVSSVISEPKVGGKGKAATYFWAATRIHSGKAMQIKGVGPNTSGRMLFYYDAAANKIRSNGVSSEGVINRESLHPSGARSWHRHTVQTAPDGTTREFQSTLTFSEDGKTLTIVINGKTADGVATKQTNVWRRIEK